jgi:TetR/AcrR family transcriptional repressor of nem operon
MRVSRKEMDKSHQRIVEGASRLLRARGIERTGVVEAMAEAGLKHGGFYRHFDSKDALVDAALQSAFDEVVSGIENRFSQADGETAGAKAIEDHRAHYLSQPHRDHPERGCPIAALGNDVARAPEPLKKSFGTGVRRVIEALAAGMEGTEEQRQTAAARELALLAGAVMIARASDPETAQLVLSACRRYPLRVSDSPIQ